jgi:integrase
LVKFSSSIRAALVTGCRQDELTKATWSQLDLYTKRLTVIGKGGNSIGFPPFPADQAVGFGALPVVAPLSHGIAVSQRNRLKRDGNGCNTVQHDLRRLGRAKIADFCGAG